MCVSQSIQMPKDVTAGESNVHFHEVKRLNICAPVESNAQWYVVISQTPKYVQVSRVKRPKFWPQVSQTFISTKSNT